LLLFNITKIFVNFDPKVVTEMVTEITQILNVMVNFYILVERSNQRKDGSYPIAIKLHWHKAKGHIPTGLCATKKQTTATSDGSIKLTDSFLVRLLGERIAIYEKIVLEMGLSVNSYTAKGLAAFVISRANELTAIQTSEATPALSLTDFANIYIEKQKELNRKRELNSGGSAVNIQTAMNSIHRFANKKNLTFDDITVDFLNGYCHWMLTTQGRDGKGVKGRGLQLYLGVLNHLFRMAEGVHNDKRTRKMVIFNPLEDYKIPKPPAPKKRAITLEQIRLIRDTTIATSGTRVDLARDMFMLSFYLVGMNSVDLYLCPVPADGRITYKRAKTRHRRADEAEFSIKVPAEALPIIEKYKGNGRLLNVCKHYSTVGTFNAAINKGLKALVRAMKVTSKVDLSDIEGLSFYSARHTWATIAENNVGLSTSLVDKCLNHVDERLKVARGYIKTDWRPINKANREVLDFLASGVEIADDD
jgi:hypothetical protein